MAIFKKGILGGFSGAVGPVIGSSWKKRHVLKSRPNRRKTILSDQHIKLGMLSNLLSAFSSPIKIGFYKKKNKDNAQNSAIQYNITRVFGGESPDFEIDYKKIVFSRGLREPAWSGTTIWDAKGQLRISWEIPETAKLNLIANDQAVVLIYNSSRKKRLEFQALAARKQLYLTIPIPEIYRNDTFHVWLFFISADGKMVSNSEYMGTVR